MIRFFTQMILKCYGMNDIEINLHEKRKNVFSSFTFFFFKLINYISKYYSN